MDTVSFKFIAIHSVILVLFCFASNLEESLGERLKVRKLSKDPVFVGLGETLMLEIDIENLEVDKWNTTALWIFISDSSSDRRGRDLLLSRRIGSPNAHSYPYEPRASSAGQANLLLVNTTFNDTGKYQCMLRRPPNHWEVIEGFSVTVEGRRVQVETLSPDTVYLATGNTLKLDITLTNFDFYNRKLSAFWEFRSVSSSSYKRVLFLGNIGVKGSPVKRYDPRASLEEKGSLVLANVTPGDSGTYNFRIIRPPSNGSVRADFHVIVEDKPRAKITCANVISLAEGEHFSCWCKAIRGGRLVPQASWIKTGLIIRAPGHSSQELSLNHFNKDMVGTYICRANVSTLVDEQKVKINIIRIEPKVEQCLKERSKWYLILTAGCGGLLLGIIITIGIHCIREKRQRNYYDEPIDVKSPSQYQELEMKRRNDEHHYQSLQQSPKKGNKC